MAKNSNKQAAKTKAKPGRKYVKQSKHDDQADQGTVTEKQRSIDYRRRKKTSNSAVVDERNAKEDI